MITVQAGRASVDLDVAAGTAVMRKGAWSARVPIATLPAWLEFYRRLWARGSKRPGQPGPWSRFYDDDVKALALAIEEVRRGG